MSLKYLTDEESPVLQSCTQHAPGSKQPILSPTDSRPIPWARPTLFGGEEALVLDALRSSWVSGGPYVDRLEKEIASLVGVRYALAVSNGTTAIELALRGLDLERGDEVIVPAFTFVAAPAMVLSVGLTPLYADID